MIKLCYLKKELELEKLFYRWGKSYIKSFGYWSEIFFYKDDIKNWI